MAHYKMSDVAIEINERENNPANSQYDRFVGLEHYVSGDVIIRNYGSTERLESTMKVFQCGDVLVARRNVYLKRASMVDFDGLTSGDSIVLRAINPTIGRVLPFVLNTDSFWDFADQYSDGTMSKRLSPKTLMKYEFDLPEESELENFADLLWAANDAKESYQALLQQTDELVKSQFIEMFGNLETASPKTKFTLQELIDMNWIMYHLDGNHGGDYPRSEEFVKTGVPYISANCISNGVLSFENAKYVTDERAKKFKKGIAVDGDVLFAHNATVGPVAILHTKENKVILGTSLTAYRCNHHHILREFLAAFMISDSFISQYERDMQQSTRKQVPITTQRKYTFIVPDMEQQRKFSAFVEQTDKSKYIKLKRSVRLVRGGDLCA